MTSGTQLISFWGAIVSETDARVENRTRREGRTRPRLREPGLSPEEPQQLSSLARDVNQGSSDGRGCSRDSQRHAEVRLASRWPFLCRELVLLCSSHPTSLKPSPNRDPEPNPNGQADPHEQSCCFEVRQNLSSWCLPTTSGGCPLPGYLHVKLHFTS